MWKSLPIFINKSEPQAIHQFSHLPLFVLLFMFLYIYLDCMEAHLFIRHANEINNASLVNRCTHLLEQIRFIKKLTLIWYQEIRLLESSSLLLEYSRIAYYPLHISHATWPIFLQYRLKQTRRDGAILFSWFHRSLSRIHVSALSPSRDHLLEVPSPEIDEYHV